MTLLASYIFMNISFGAFDIKDDQAAELFIHKGGKLTRLSPYANEGRSAFGVADIYIRVGMAIFTLFGFIPAMLRFNRPTATNFQRNGAPIGTTSW